MSDNKQTLGLFHILFEPETLNNQAKKEELAAKYKQMYIFMGEEPMVEIKANALAIQVNKSRIAPYEQKVNQATALSEKREFDKAERLFVEVLKDCPFYSDCYRIRAQIEMERGHVDEAINICIDALCYCPSNLWALILMGNLLVRKGELKAADSYYQKVMTFYPDHALALNNVGAVYLQRGDLPRAKEFLEKALEQKPDYLNSYYGLAMVCKREGHLMEAFKWIHKGLLKGIDRPENKETREECVKMMISLASEIVKSYDFNQPVESYRRLLEARDNAPIEMKIDTKTHLYARLKYRYAYYEDKHTVVYNNTMTYYQHHILHELTHLAMALDARAEGKNQIMLRTIDAGEAYDKKFKPLFKPAFNKLGGEKMLPIYRQIQEGLSLQLMNCPLDLLVEDRIYEMSPTLRPLQLCALLKQEEDNIKSVESAMRSPLIPKEVVRLSKVMNIVTGMHLKQLYGINFLNYYKPTRDDYNKAQDLYEEYLAYKDDCKPGDEYDLMNYFIESLDCDGLLGMMNETELREYGQRNKEQPEEEPKNSAERERLSSEFTKEQAAGQNDTRDFMMVMYMIGALEFFEGMPMNQIQQIAFEIAMVGVNGISPDKKGYKVRSIPGKEFGGYQFLAYYYVSWALCEPNRVDDLGLPYRSIYETALEMYKKKKR